MLKVKPQYLEQYKSLYRMIYNNYQRLLIIDRTIRNWTKLTKFMNSKIILTNSWNKLIKK